MENIYERPTLPETWSDKVKFVERIFKGSPIVDYMVDNEFFTAPASTKYHGAYVGGLFEHSYYVGYMLDQYTKKLGLTWARPESPWIVGLLHDLCKIDSYEKVATNWNYDGETTSTEFVYSEKPIIKGHGDKSLIYALSYTYLTPEEIACIRYHMGAYETEEWRDFDKAIKKYPNVLYTHMADMHASKVFGV